MMNLNQAIAYGRQIGVRYIVCTSSGCIFGGTKTRKDAEAMKRRFEIEDRNNPWTRGSTRFEIRPAR